MTKKFLRMSLICFACIPIVSWQALQALELDITLTNLASIDIIVSEKAPMMGSIISNPLVNNTGKAIALYSFMVNADNQIMLWWQEYNSPLLPSLLSPIDRMSMPTMQELLDPIVLDIDPELDEVYVTVYQRTYWYNAMTNGLSFYGKTALTQQFYDPSSTITITANGVINPAKFSQVPPSLQSTYQMATGSAS